MLDWTLGRLRGMMLWMSGFLKPTRGHRVKRFVNASASSVEGAHANLFSADVVVTCFRP
jgi:hypothetical protein